MTGDELSRQLKRLGMNNHELSAALKLGKGGDRTVRRWLSGERSIRGPMEVAIGAVLKERASYISSAYS